MDIHKIAKYRLTEDRAYEWWIYSNSYMVATRYLAERLKQLEDGDASEATKSNLLLPILFNLRHVVELFLKFLSVMFLRQVEPTHDSSELLKIVSKAVNNIPADQKAFEEAAQAMDMSLEDFPKFLKGTIIAVRSIVYNYGSLPFLTDSKAEIDDPKNALFRYPSTITGEFTLDFDQLPERIRADQILNDLNALQLFQTCCVFLFFRTPDGKMFFDKLDKGDEEPA